MSADFNLDFGAQNQRAEVKQQRSKDTIVTHDYNMYNGDLTRYGTHAGAADAMTEKTRQSQSGAIARRLGSTDTEVTSTIYRRVSNTAKDPYVEMSDNSAAPYGALKNKGYSYSARDPPRTNLLEDHAKAGYYPHEGVRGVHVPHRSKGAVMKSGASSESTVWELPERYKIIDIVGSGSYGQVCRAFDIKNQRYVAIKRIHKVFEDLIDCKRILREIAILNRLDHPNVVKVLDIVIPYDIENFNVLYVVLEIAASDIKLLVKSPAFLNDNHIRLLIFNLLSGVNYLHKMGIFHRDLKPANCLVNRDCSVKICDFGLARTVDYHRYPCKLGDNGSITARDVEDEMCQGDATARTMPDSGRPQDYNEEIAYFQRKKQKETYSRQLTHHVVTRWYRAPELILLQENYTAAIDVWSAGCIFAELLNMVKNNVPDSTARSPLFPGSSCFPLSPDNKNSSDKARDNDQLNMIFNIIGTPSEADIAAIAKPDVRRYVRMFHKRSPIDFRKRFRASSPLAIDLLKRMLTFDPEKRITVNDALKHEYFKDLYNPQLMEYESQGVALPFNDWINMSEGQLRYAFLREIQRYHPEFKIPLKIIYKT
ncbi:STKc MAPK [Babesia gibsoni]|uniref:Mitogen-activated protein kinase n=1 Tax=Babesia gibsoni TaxID=33632 RepID=A0AAD8LI82_BABGI|nr:STKc MAPK [Babesia gibsoni]